MNDKTIAAGKFASKLNEFITQKRVLGYLYEDAFYKLNNFANFVYTKYPDADILTKEIAFDWCLKKDDENSKTLTARVILMREFAKYLISIGEKAFIIPTELLPKTLVKPTHIYKMEELKLFWQEVDMIPDAKGQFNSLVFPAVFRMLYCCGLRPTEPLKLRVQDVDLTNGTIDILESKGHKSRNIPLPDDFCTYLKRYHEQISRLIPDRIAFFPNKKGDHHNYWYLFCLFKKIRENLFVLDNVQPKPQLYDFRHSFATHRLYLWLHEGKDLNAMLPYLSSFMGHADLPSTYYYIHFVPGLFEQLAGEQFMENQNLLPEVIIP
jgi:integrase/recombinase XerD